MYTIPKILLAFVLMGTLNAPSFSNINEEKIRPKVNTTNGEIIGLTRNGADEYRGIPYGIADRLDLAKSAPKWQKPLDAENFGPACAQQRRFDLTEESLVEDCLSLNVSTPVGAKPNQNLPVIVWIPGGAFVGGSSNLYRLDKLAREGNVVLVSMNYRLGVFGFMAHPAIKEGWNGNLGLEDQRLALAWVKNNIANFGGNPNNITVAGESAGGGSVCLHLLSGKKAAGLFKQAIIESAGCMQEMPTLKESLSPSTGVSQALWHQVSKSLGCTGSPSDQLACLKSKPTKDILIAQGNVSKGIMAFGPTIANGTVPLNSYTATEISNMLNRVPILYGGAENELRLYVAYKNLFTPNWNVSNISKQELETRWIPTYYGSTTSAQTSRIIEEYFTPLGRNMTGGELGSMVSDFAPIVGINHCIYQKTANVFSRFTTLYQWEFADPDAPVLGVGIAPGMIPDMKLGAVHSAQLNYLFPNLSNTAAINAPDLNPHSQKLADILVQTWASFAKNGSPQTRDIPTWPSFKSTNGDPKKLMRFESPNNIGMYDANAQHRCDFWKGQFPDQLTQLQ